MWKVAPKYLVPALAATIKLRIFDLMADSSSSEGGLPVAMRARRDHTIAALSEHFSDDRLTLEEFERRLDVAHRALTLPELESLLADLPAPSQQPAATPTPAGPPAPRSHIREQQTLIAIMGGVERRGRWQPAQRTFVLAFMGGGVLDFREVMLPPGETDVTIFAFMGGVEVIVPPGMNVDVSGFALMGGFGHNNTQPEVPSPNAPLLKIHGFAMMGGVEVQVRMPGETEKDARVRAKEERRRLREEWRRR